MSDPLDDFFGLPAIHQAGGDVGAPVEDNPDPARDIEKQAITEDVDLVRKTLRAALTDGASKMPTVMELAIQMQDPDMIDSASKMMSALSKLSIDLINIDLRVLQESKKVPPAPAIPEGGEQAAGNQPVRATSTADVIRAIKEVRKADRLREQAEERERNRQNSTTVEPKEQ